MIGKVLQNNNFKETTRYVLVKEKARLLGSAVLESEADAIAQEFRLSRDLQPEIERPVYHLIASYSYEDAATKNLSDAFQLERAIEHFAGLVVSARTPALLRQDDKTAYKQQVNDFIETELYEYQWFCATHEDTKHKHTHFVASRINIIDGRCIPTWQDKERSQRICREMEREYGLQPLQSFYELKRRSPTRKQRDQWEATGIPPVMVMMQDAIDQEATPGRSIEQVLTALQEQHGVDTKISLDHGTQGIVFEQTDSKGETVRMSGSQLGRGYTYAAISRRLEPERESELTPPAVATKLEQRLEADETTQPTDPLELLQVTQPAIPALRRAPEPQPVAVAPALRRAPEPQPAAVAPALTGTADQAAGLTEPIGADSDRVDALTRQQTEANLQALALSRQAWAQEMARIAAQILQLTRKTEYEGEHYRWVLNDKVLIIEAKDGRGVLVQYQRHDVMVNHAITEADKNYFQAQAKKAVAKAQLGR